MRAPRRAPDRGIGRGVRAGPHAGRRPRAHEILGAERAGPPFADERPTSP